MRLSVRKGAWSLPKPPNSAGNPGKGWEIIRLGLFLWWMVSCRPVHSIPRPGVLGKWLKGAACTCSAAELSCRVALSGSGLLNPAVKVGRQVDRGADRIGLHTNRLCADDPNKATGRSLVPGTTGNPETPEKRDRRGVTDADPYPGNCVELFRTPRMLRW